MYWKRVVMAPIASVAVVDDGLALSIVLKTIHQYRTSEKGILIDEMMF